MRCGSGTNTKGELLSLWLLFHFSLSLGFDNISIYGESKVIIDWAVEVHDINILHLLAWLKQTRLMIHRFKSISFAHIFRENNHMAGNISKKAL